MSFTIPGDCVQVTINWAGSVFRTGHAATVFGLTGNTDDLNEIADAVVAALSSTLAVTLNSAVSIQNVTVVSDARVHVEPVGDAGDRSGALAPPNTCLLIKLTTGLRGRANRGRNYWPGQLNDGDVGDDGTIEASRLADLQATFGDFINQLVTAGWAMTILHRDGSPASTVTGGEVEPKVATQRRRLR